MKHVVMKVAPLMEPHEISIDHKKETQHGIPID